MTPRTQSRHRGFTVVEMVLSMAVMTVLLGGIASALVIAGRAVPGTATPASLAVDGYHAAERLATELYAAQTVTARSATSVAFTVADRDADGNPETIQYTWSGVAGDPLNRRYNGGAPGTVLDSAYQFNVGYVTQVISGANLVTIVNITIQAGSDTAARVDTSVQLLNQPS